MPYLESVEEAQLIHEQSKENREENFKEIIGVELDAEKEQEVGDIDEEGEEDHPEYLHIDPVQVQQHTEGETEARCILQTIAIPSKELQVEEASQKTAEKQIAHRRTAEAGRSPKKKTIEEK